MFIKTLKTITGILLIPAAMAVARSFYTQISGTGMDTGTLQMLERGVLFYLLFHIFIVRPVYLYVLGHEFVHVLATWICGGTIVSFDVTPSGGNVVTSKTNFFIELSPYFVPIYTIALGLIFLIIKLAGGNVLLASASNIFIFFIGVTLAYHFVMTSEVLRIQQPDVAKSGMTFSLVILFIGNLIVTMAVFCPIFGELSFLDFIRGSISGSGEFYNNMYAKITDFINTFQN